MNSFRVLNARFRILKGGKIGLSLSIFLLGSMLTFSKTNALATDYFTGVQSTFGSFTTNTSGATPGSAKEITVQTATNSGLTTATRTETTYNAVIFNPISWANSFYSTPTYTGNSGGYYDYTLNTTSSDLNLSLTFASGANALGILKDNTTIYSAPIIGPVSINSDTTYNLTSSISSDYTANLIFSGSNNVSGATDIGDGNISFTGGGSIFTGTVNAGSMDVNTTGTIRFNSDVDLSTGTTDELNFIQGGTVEFGSDFKGNITTNGVNNQGTVTFLGGGSGKTQILTGDVGSSTSSDIATLNVGSGGGFYSTLTINGDIYSNSTVLNNNSTLILSNNSDLNSSSITTNTLNTGTLTLNGSSIVTGTVGSTNALKDVNSGVNGTTSTFSGIVNSQNVTNTGSGTTIFQDDVTATNVNVNTGTSTFQDNLNATTTTITTGTGNFNTLSGTTSSNIVFGGNGTANLNNGLTGNVTTNTLNTGTLNLVGNKNQTITGTVGSTNTLKDVNSGVNGTTSTFSGIVNSQNVTNTGSGTTIFQDDVTATNVNVNTGTSTFQDNLNATTTTITTGTGNFNTLSGTTSSNIVFGGNGTANLNNGLTGNVTTNTLNTGTLTLNGSSIVTGTVGSTNALKDVNSGVNGTTSTFSGIVNSQNVTNTGSGTTIFQDDVTATNVNVNTGTSTFQDNLNATTTTITTGTGNFNTLSGTTSSNIVFGGNGTANLNNGLTGNVTTNTLNTGTLTLNGSSIVTGTVGSTNALKDVNSGVNGTTSTFSGIVNSQNVTNTGSGTTIFQDDVTATNVNVNTGTSTFQDNLNATTTTITTGTGNFNTLSGTTSSNIVFGGNGTANLNNGLTGNVTTNTLNTGTLTLNGSSIVTGTVGSTNALKDVNSGVNGTTSTFSGIVNSQNVTNTGSGTTIFQDDVTATNVNVNTGTSTFQDNLNATTTTITTGTGNFNTLSGTTSSNIVFGGNGTANLNNGLTGNVTTNTLNTGTLTLNGSSIVTGTVGSTNALKDVNSGVNGTTSTFSGIVNSQNVTNTGSGTTIFQDDVTATNVNVNTGTSTFQDNLNATTTTITTGTGNFNTLSGTTSSNIVFGGNGTANLNNGLTGNVTTNTLNTGTLNLVGNKNQTITGTVGSTNALKDVNSGVNGTTSTFSGIVNSQNVTNTGSGTTIFQDDVTATNVNVNTGTSTFQDNLNATTTTITTGTGNFNTLSGTTSSNIVFGGNGTANLNNGLTGNVTTNTLNTGTLNLVGNKNQTITGTVGSTNTLKDVNSGVNGTTSTFSGIVNSQNVTNTGSGTTIFQDDVTATNVNVNTGTSTFQDNLNATTTTITTGTGNFNTLSGTTSSNIVFGGNGTANLYGNLTGDINFSGNDAIVNIADGKGILGSVETLANNNTGILNFKGDGVIDGIIGSVGLGIEELNINSENEQDSTDGVKVTYSALGREIYADTINLKNNATFTLSDGVDLIDTGSDNIIVKVDINNTGKLTFEGTSTIDGEVGQSNKVLNTINAGATGETVTFNDMVYATTLKYSDNGTVVLNGDNSSNANAEGFKGTVDLSGTTGTLEIGDGVNLTTGTSGIQFANANNATLTFNGTSNVLGNIGSENGLNDTFKTINAGASNETVKFEDNVYVIDSLNLISSNGKVQIADGNYVKRNSNSTTTGAMITTSTNGFGDLEYLGSTILHSDIGTSSLKLNNITFASTGNSSNIYNQDIDKNVYALNTTIGNGTNNTSANISSDIRFGGNLNVNSNSILNVSNYDITIDDNLNLASNSTTKFKVYTTDISAGQAVTNGDSGSIKTDTVNVASDSKVHIDYEGSWYGAGKYNLITSNSLTGTYNGTEANGLVSDNSIIDSIVKVDGNNLTLYSDRTGGGSYNAEDLYIVKSEIGKDYSNNASQSLAGYANDTQREGALADIIKKIEDLDDGVTISQAKKDEMIAIQRKLTPIANSSNMQTAVSSTNLATTTVGSRLSDIRRTETNNFTPNIYKGNYAGLSSGDYGYDTSFWVKGIGAKATQNKVKEYYGFNNTTYGFVAGMDKTMHNGSIFGIAIGYSDTKTNQDNVDSDSSNTNSVQATIYSSKEFGNTYLDGYLSYSKHTTDGTRTANSGKVTSSVDSDQISAKVESGHNFRVNDGITLTPFASLEYSLLNQKGYTEKGSTYQNDALKVDGLKLNRGTVEVGAKLTSNIELEDTLIIPQFTASVYNSFGDNKADVKAQYVGGGNKFTTPVQELNQTMVNVGVGVETKISDSTSLIFDIEHDRSKDGNFESYSGNVTFGVSF